jgi:hypothetical protein
MSYAPPKFSDEIFRHISHYESRRRKSMSDKNKLDVDFEIIEEPEDELFPRLPNVVSHRGHSVKIIAIIRSLPEPQEGRTISLRARVLVLDKKTMGAKGHISRPAEIWGEALDEPPVKITSEEFPNLPFSINIIVPKDDKPDDHLGEGPHYQALVNITTSTGGGDAVGGAEDGTAASSDLSFDDQGLYIIAFTSK